MVKIDVKFDSNIDAGIAAFEAKIKDSVIFTGAAAMARVIYEEVRLNAHRRTVSGNRREKNREPGTLENAVYRAYSPEQSPDGVKTYHVSVNKTKASHWHWVEFGNSRQAARPFIRPAFDRVNDAIKVGNEAMRQRLAGRG